MKNSNGGLYFDSLIDDKRFNQQLKDMENRISNFSNASVQETQRLDNAFNSLAATAAGFFTIQAASNFVQQLISIRGEFEQLEIAFTTMLGSKAKADALMADIARFAATTPFDLKSTAAGTKQLLAYGFAAEDMTDNLAMLGNVASGVGSQLGDLIYLYGTLKASGRVTQMDINQFAGRGIPIYEALGKVLETNTEQVRDFVSSGKVGFTEIEKAFQSMTGSSGMFFNLMQEQSKSITGQLSNLGDAFDSMLNKLGESSQDTFSSIISSATLLVENYDKVLSILGSLVAGYGAYRAALLATVAMESSALIIREATLINGARLTAMQKLHVLWIAIETKARAALNAVMLANPYAVVTGAIVAMGIAMWALHDSTTSQEKAFKQLSNEAEAAGKALDDLKAKASSLMSVLNDKNATDYQQTKAFEELKKLYPQLFENLSKEAFLKLEAAEAQRILNEENDKMSVNSIENRYKAANNEVEELTKKLEAYKNVAKGSASESAGVSKAIESTASQLEVAKIKAEQLQKEFEKEKETLRFSKLTNEEKVKLLEKQKTEIQNQIKAIENLARNTGQLQNVFNQLNLNKLKNDLQNVSNQIFSLNNPNLTEKRSLLKIDSEISDKKDKQQSATTRAEYQAIQKDIDKLEAEKARITGNYNKKEVAALDQLKKDKKEILDDISRAENDAVLNSMEASKREIEIKRKEFAELRKLAKEAKLGEGVITRIDRVEEKVIGQVEYKQSTESFKNHLEQEKALYEAFEKHKVDFGVKAANEKYSKEVDIARTFAQRLEEERANLLETDSGSMNAFQLERLAVLDALIDQEYQKEAANRMQLLKEYESFEQQRKLIYEKYAKVYTDLGEQITDTEKEEIKERLNNEIKSINEQQFKKTKLYKRLSEQLTLQTKESLKAELKAAEELLKTSDLPYKIQQQVQDHIDALKDILNNGVTSSNKSELEKRKKDLIEALANPLIEGTEKAKEYRRELLQIQDAINNLDAAELNEVASFAGKVGFRLGQASAALSDLSHSLEGVNDDLAYTLGTLSELAAVGEDVAGAVASFASGDIISGITKTMQAVAGLLSIGKKVKQMNEAARAEQKKLYDEAIKGEREYQSLLRKRDVDEVARNKNSYNQLIARLDLLKKQAPEIEAAYNKIFNSLQNQNFIDGVGYQHGTWLRKAKTWDIMASLFGSDYEELEKLYTKGQLKDQTKEDFEALKALKEELYEAGLSIEDIQNQLNNLLTGTSVSGLADGLAELFQNGKRSAADFGASFEQILKTSIQNTFKYKVMEDALSPFYASLSNMMVNGTPSQNEIEALRSQYEQISLGLASKYEELEKITGIKAGESSESGLKGSIRRELSEQTGSELAGLGRASYDLYKRMFDLSVLDNKLFVGIDESIRQQLFFLSGIRENTSEIANNTSRLAAIEKSLDVIATNTKSSQSSRGLGI